MEKFADVVFEATIEIGLAWIEYAQQERIFGDDKTKYMEKHSREKEKAEMLVGEVWSCRVRGHEGKQLVETLAPNTDFRAEGQLAR